MVKVCSKCNIEKSALYDFSVKRSNKDGLNSQCRDCVSVRRKAYYEANREKEAISGYFWRQNNSEAISEYNRYYHELNKMLGIDPKAKYKKHKVTVSGPWTQSEIDILIKDREDEFRLIDTAKFLERSYESVSSKAKRLRLQELL